MNNIIKCFVIDDEPSSREVLRKFVLKVPFISIVGEYENAVDALFQIRITKPDLIFLDIEMPEMNGLDFIKAMQPNTRPRIIMISAYTKYAIEGFEHQVVDYLHKPIAFDRFTRSLQKLLEQIPESSSIFSPEDSSLTLNQKLSAGNLAENRLNHREDILVKVDKKLVRIRLKDILMIEPLGDYVKIHLDRKFVITHMTMNNINSMLPEGTFLRISRFCIINKFIIEEIDGNRITTITGEKLMVGVSFRDKVVNQLLGN